MGKVEIKIKNIAVKLRKIRELKGLTREQFCEPLGENSDYWGLIERGEQAISLPKLLAVCEIYNIPIEEVVELGYENIDDGELRNNLNVLLDKCNTKQIEIIIKFVEEIGSII